MNYESWRSSQVRLREAVRSSRPTPSSASEKSGARTATDSTPRSPFASVIVVCADAERVIGRCIEQLLAQDYPHYELIVVDDASTDRTAAIAQTAADDGALQLVRSKRNRGCPGARNLGLRHARGEIVAFVDADGFAAPDWLSEIIATFAGDDTIGAVASTVFYDRNPIVINGAGGTVNRQGWAADLLMNESYEHAEIAEEALYPMGCGMAIRRDALERVGPFDDRMHNYYDDVDYGVRLWRVGYRVVVAREACVDHGIGSGGDDDAGALAADNGRSAARKRLLCERHRMRVVLVHAPGCTLGAWAANELRSLHAAPMPVRRQKLAAVAWNARHLTSALRRRRALRSVERVPDRLVDDSWGDAFPAGVPLRSTPDASRAGPKVAMGNPEAERQLLHGWYPLERIDGREYRWAAEDAAVLISLDCDVRSLRLDYTHVPVDIGGVDLTIRRVNSSDPAAVVWSTHLAWQYAARSIENHPLALPSGDYEVGFSAATGWLEPPLRTRSLSFALAEMAFLEQRDSILDGLDMSAPNVEPQLVRGWFEPEQAPVGGYRWSSAHAAAVICARGSVSGVHMRYRLPPGPSGPVRVTFTPLGPQAAAASWQIAWRQGDWQEETFAVKLAPGEYLVDFDAAEPWSNPRGEQAGLPPEKRTLGLALAAITLV
jgi:GT2 family glycosyltransferase